MSGVQSVGMALLLIGGILTTVSVCMPTWSKNDPTDTTRDSIQTIKGLWMQCTTFAAGNWDCDDYDRIFLGLPAQLQAGRMLGIGSILCAIVGFCVCVIGLDCMPLVNSSSQKKTFRLVSGSLCLISSLLLLIATCWYANDLRVQHNQASIMKTNQSDSSVKRFIFGEALFVGWAASVVQLIGGILVVCSGCGSDEDENYGGRGAYAYHPTPAASKPAHIGAAQEYV